MVYLLQGAVDFDFRVIYLKISRGIEPLPLSEYDKKRKTRAMALSLADARDKVARNIDEGKVSRMLEVYQAAEYDRDSNRFLSLQFTVQSFTVHGIEYSVDMDMAKNLLLSCSCLDYCQHKIPCKHMYLVQRVQDDLGIKYSADLVPNSGMVNNGDYSEAVLGNTFSQHVLHQLQVARAEERQQKKEVERRPMPRCLENAKRRCSSCGQGWVSSWAIPARGSAQPLTCEAPW